jgi:hypothetical protein
MTGLVFFLLIGKVFQRKTYERLAFDRDYKSFFPLTVTRVRSGVMESWSVGVMDGWIVRGVRLGCGTNRSHVTGRFFLGHALRRLHGRRWCGFGHGGGEEAGGNVCECLGGHVGMGAEEERPEPELQGEALRGRGGIETQVYAHYGGSDVSGASDGADGAGWRPKTEE